MKTIELINVLPDKTFVAVGSVGHPISYSGSACGFKSTHFLATSEVVSVIPHDDRTATIIYVK